jgi:hypothetical protein
MPRRPWALCALVLLAGCATSEPAARPRKKPAPPAEAAGDDEESSVPVPPAPEPRPAAKPEPRAEAAATPPPEEKAPPEPKRTAADPFGDVGFHEVNEKDWLAGIREKIAKQEKVEPTDLRLSPGLLRAAYVRSPQVAPPKPGRKPAPRRHEIVVVDNQGRRVASFRPVTAPKSDEPPKDLRFLGEERLVYEVVAPPPPDKPPPVAKAKTKGRLAARANAKKKTPPSPARAAAPAPPPGPPPRTFVIQPLAPRARPIKCVGLHHTFTKERDHLAFVAGQPEASFVAVDGGQVYPRRGRTVVASAPAWSKDGRSLAFLEKPRGEKPRGETPAERPARLVLVAEIDNPTGDTTWDLPPTANTEGALVHWAGTGKLVVGRTQMRPIFSASFTKELPGR